MCYFLVSAIHGTSFINLYEVFELIPHLIPHGLEELSQPSSMGVSRPLLLFPSQLMTLWAQSNWGLPLPRLHMGTRPVNFLALFAALLAFHIVWIGSIFMLHIHATNKHENLWNCSCKFCTYGRFGWTTFDVFRAMINLFRPPPHRQGTWTFLSALTKHLTVKHLPMMPLNFSLHKSINT